MCTYVCWCRPWQMRGMNRTFWRKDLGHTFNPKFSYPDKSIGRHLVNVSKCLIKLYTVTDFYQMYQDRPWYRPWSVKIKPAGAVFHRSRYLMSISIDIKGAKNASELMRYLRRGQVRQSVFILHAYQEWAPQWTVQFLSVKLELIAALRGPVTVSDKWCNLKGTKVNCPPFSAAAISGFPTLWAVTLFSINLSG